MTISYFCKNQKHQDCDGAIALFTGGKDSYNNLVLHNAGYEDCECECHV